MPKFLVFLGGGFILYIIVVIPLNFKKHIHTIRLPVKFSSRALKTQEIPANKIYIIFNEEKRSDEHSKQLYMIFNYS